MGQEDCPARTDGAGVVHVIDDDEAVRRGLAILLRSGGIAAETHASALAFLDKLPSLNEGSVLCVITDVRMPGLDGLDLLHRLNALRFRRPVIVMTAHGDVPKAVQAMKAGAADFVEKPFRPQDLLALIEQLSGPPSTAGEEGAAARMASLSPREREVLDRLIAGKPNKQIARELGLSHRTVEVHRARMMERLGVSSLAEAVRIAVEAELGQRA